MFDHAHEELESESNASFDYVREAYAATMLDPLNEGFCSYLDDCDHEGIEPKSFDEWEAGLRAPREQLPLPADSLDGIPF